MYISTTASALNAMLAFINPEQTPKIAWDRDDLAEPLIAKVKEAVGKADGTMRVAITFDESEKDLQHQFSKVAEAISNVFEGVSYNSKVKHTIE